MYRSKSKKKQASKSFNLMVAGHCRIGKTAFIHTLFETLAIQKLIQVTESDSPLSTGDLTVPTPSPAWIETLDAYGTQRILLRLIDTPGIDIPAGIHKAPPVIQDALSEQALTYARLLSSYIEAQFESTLVQESKVVRDRNALDLQVHALLYLISPDSILACKGLAPMDRIVLKYLKSTVNIIPCIGKSDIATVRDLKMVREYLKNDLVTHDIQVYRFEPEEDEDGNVLDLNEKMPFCLVGSEMLDDSQGQGLPLMGVNHLGEMILGREYIWGVVKCQDPSHCDFNLIKEAILGSHLDDLREETSQVLYENWRTQRLITNRASIHVPSSIKERMSIMATPEPPLLTKINEE